MYSSGMLGEIVLAKLVSTFRGRPLVCPCTQTYLVYVRYYLVYEGYFVPQLSSAKTIKCKYSERQKVFEAL